MTILFHMTVNLEHRNITLEPFEEMIDGKTCDFQQDNTIPHGAQMFVQATEYAEQTDNLQRTVTVILY
jgi:hypothetical protein